MQDSKDIELSSLLSTYGLDAEYLDRLLSFLTEENFILQKWQGTEVASTLHKSASEMASAEKQEPSTNSADVSREAADDSQYSSWQELD